MSHPDRLRSVLDHLLCVLEEHRVTLWNEIDNRNTETVEAGTARFQDYLRRSNAFRTAAEGIADFFDGPGLFVDPNQVRETSKPAPPTGGGTIDDDRPTRRLDPTLERALDEEFSHTKPAAVRIGDSQYRDVDSWRRVYELVLKHLADQDPDRFARLPTDRRFISPREHHDFSHRSQDLRTSSQITPTLFAEVHFSANNLRNRMRKLLEAFGLPASTVGIYLRSDRPA